MSALQLGGYLLSERTFITKLGGSALPYAKWFVPIKAFLRLVTLIVYQGLSCLALAADEEQSQVLQTLATLLHKDFRKVPTLPVERALCAKTLCANAPSLAPALYSLPGTYASSRTHLRLHS